MLVTFDDVGLARVADALEALAEVEHACRVELDPEVADLCRIRIAMLLGNGAERGRAGGGIDAAKLSALPMWPSSPEFSALERACLAYAEQVVIDVTGVDDETVTAVLEASSAVDVYVLARMVQASEARQRCELLFRHDARLSSLASSAAAIALGP